MFGQPVNGSEGWQFFVDGEELFMEPFTGWQAMGWAVAADWSALVPKGLEEESFLYVAERLSDPYDSFSLGHCHHIATTLADDIFGVPWYAAVRLAVIAQEAWQAYVPWSASVGFNFETASAQRICGSIQLWLQQAAKDEAHWNMTRTKIFMPPPQQRHRAETSLEEFMSQMQQMGGDGDDDDDE